MFKKASISGKSINVSYVVYADDYWYVPYTTSSLYCIKKNAIQNINYPCVGLLFLFFYNFRHKRTF